MNQLSYTKIELTKRENKMTKKLLAKVGTYQNAQGETKNDYVKLGVVISGDNGDFMLLDPSVNLAGALIKQNVMNMAEGKPQRDSVMVSVFDGDNHGHNQQQGGFQQPQQQQGGYQQAPQQGTQGYGQGGPQAHPNQSGGVPQNNEPPF